MADKMIQEEYVEEIIAPPIRESSLLIPTMPQNSITADSLLSWQKKSRESRMLKYWKHCSPFAVTELKEVLKIPNTVSQKFSTQSVHIFTDFSSPKVYEIYWR